MRDTIRRYFKMVIGVIGAFTSGGLVVLGLKNGSVPGFSRADLVSGVAYPKESAAGPFWFALFFWAVACAGFLWMAWSRLS